jgi:hypothetical protein
MAGLFDSDTVQAKKAAKKRPQSLGISESFR